MKKLTFTEVLERFELIEKKLDLDQSLIEGVPWWDTFRYQLFNEILINLNFSKHLEDNITPKRKNYIKKRISLIFIMLRNSLKFLSKRSPIWIKKNSNIILGHPRRVLEKNVYIDPYTDPFIDLFSKKIKFSVLERALDGKNHFSPAKTSNLYYTDFLNNFANIISKFRIINFSQKDKSILLELETQLYKEFSYSVNIKKKVKKIIKDWLGIYPLMVLFFKFKKPKNLFVIVSHSQEAIIAAAKSLGINTFELQHGSPVRSKLNYDYSSGIKKRSFPDFFLSFGGFWSSNCELPINKKKIISFGNEYLYKKLDFYSNTPKQNRLVVISQAHPILAKFAQDIRKHFPKKIIVEYKPHPAEYYGDEPEYFSELRNSGVIISNRHTALYEILSKSRWQVGIDSTALYEGLYFGTACFILSHDGELNSNNMKNIIEAGCAKLISSPQDIDLNWVVDIKKLKEIFIRPNKKNITYLSSLMI
jgi:hypothetical protein